MECVPVGHPLDWLVGFGWYGVCSSGTPTWPVCGVWMVCSLFQWEIHLISLWGFCGVQYCVPVEHPLDQFVGFGWCAVLCSSGTPTWPVRFGPTRTEWFPVWIYFFIFNSLPFNQDNTAQHTSCPETSVSVTSVFWVDKIQRPTVPQHQVTTDRRIARGQAKHTSHWFWGECCTRSTPCSTKPTQYVSLCDIFIFHYGSHLENYVHVSATVWYLYVSLLWSSWELCACKCHCVISLYFIAVVILRTMCIMKMPQRDATLM